MRFPASRRGAAGHAALLALPPAAPLLVAPLAHALQAAPAQDPLLLFGLLLAKRLALYSMATSTVALAGMRSGDSAPGLGTRVQLITKELFLPFALGDQVFTNQSTTFVEALDSSSGAQQAAGLPVLLGLILVVSAVMVNVFDPADLPQSSGASIFTEILPIVSSLSNAFVVTLLCNAEMQAFFQAAFGDSPSNADDHSVSGDTSSFPSRLALAVALISTLAAYTLPRDLASPLQNFVNICIAIGISRVLQFPQLTTVCGALLAVSFYDFLGTSLSASAADQLVNPIPHSSFGFDLSSLATDSNALQSSFSDDGFSETHNHDLPVAALADGSLMETVAKQRMGMSSSTAIWNPGLLTVTISGRITDALGLGDIVFPAILAGWARRADISASACDVVFVESGKLRQGTITNGDNSSKSDSAAKAGEPSAGYFAASLRGYIIGCLLLEIAPIELTKAALVFIAPSMILSVFSHAATRGELQDFLESADDSAK